VRLEAHKPQQLFIDSELHFGASTRVYVIRERPPVNMPKLLSSISQNSDDKSEDLNNSLNLPESEADLDVRK
jgi:nuclear inhibitor of protein phosphatase 1